jgi:hypothetical protein
MYYYKIMYYKRYIQIVVLVVAILLGILWGTWNYASHSLYSPQNNPLTQTVSPPSAGSGTVATSPDTSFTKSSSCPQASNTSSWQIYQDPQFSIQIPPNWVASSTDRELRTNLENLSAPFPSRPPFTQFRHFMFTCTHTDSMISRTTPSFLGFLPRVHKLISILNGQLAISVNLC